MNAPATTRQIRTFQPDDLIAALENANIPWKRSWREIEADFDGSGHNSFKLNPAKGVYFCTQGGGGTIAALLRQHRLHTNAPAPDETSPRPAAGGQQPVPQDTSGYAIRLWNGAWTCTHPDDMPPKWSRKASNANKKRALRIAIEQERDAVIRYLRARLGDENLLHWLRQVRITRDRDGNILMLVPMMQNGAICGVQRVFLTPEGQKIERKMIGKSGVCPLRAPTDALPVQLSDLPPLLVGEGFESVAAAMQACGQPGVACFSANGVVRWAEEQSAAIQKSGKSPNRTAIVLVDRDVSETGQKASAKAVMALRNAGATALYAQPPAPEAGGPKGGPKGADWGDYPREQIDGSALAAHLQMAISRGDEEMPELPADEPAASVVPIPFDMAGFRQAEQPEAPAPSKSVDEVRADMRTEIQKVVDGYAEWFRQNKETREPFPPALFRVTTGVGKSHALKRLPRSVALRQVDGRVVVSVQTHEQAREYEQSGFFHFWGRQPEENGPAPDAWCPNHAQLEIAMQREHVSQSEVCRTCSNGLRWAIDNAQEQIDSGKCGDKRARKLEQRIASHTRKLRARGLDPESVTPCRWQSHLQEAKAAQFLVMTHSSYSHSVVGDALFFADESFDLGKTIEVGLADIHGWAERNAQIVEKLRTELAAIEGAETLADAGIANDEYDEDEPSEETKREKKIREQRDALQKHEQAAEFFRVLAARMAEWAGKGKNGAVSIDEPLTDAIRGLVDVSTHKSASKISIAAWEKLDFDRQGNLSDAPLRAAFALADSLQFVDGGHVHKGKLVVSAPSQIVDRIRLGFPTVLMDATPPKAMADIVQADGGQIVNLIAKQNVKIARHPQRFWGLSALDPKRVGPERVEKETEKRHILRSIYPDAKILDHKRAFDQIDSGVVDGYWGAHHRAHNEWSGRDLVLLGSFFPPEGAWRAMYQQDRLAALIGGCSAEDWPAWPEDAANEEGAWICEGNADVQSRLPLPANQRIRAWLLDRITAETVQAIGRSRGANSEREVQIRVFGGVPLEGLGRHGLEISEYRADPAEVGQSRDEINAARHDAAMQIRDAAASRLAARGEEITRESVDRELFRMYQDGLYGLGKEIDTMPIQTQSSPYTYQQWLAHVQQHAPAIFVYMSKTGRGAPTVRAIMAAAEQYGRSAAKRAVVVVESLIKQGADDALDALDTLDSMLDEPGMAELERILSIVLTGDDGPPIPMIT